VPQVFNGSDWMAATGSAYAGRALGNFRPTQAVKQVMLAKPAKSARSAALARQMRRLTLDVIRATTPLDPPAPPRTRGVPLWKLNQPGREGRAAYERHAAVLQRWHGTR
jgi:hypothetical protein